MPSVIASNMVSKMYCPLCGSFDLKKLHRGYFKKVILKQPKQFKCGECNNPLSELIIEGNEPKNMPVFISK